jgi:hypothetical protein
VPRNTNRLRADIITTLQKICRDLRGMQTAADTVKAYRDVEKILTDARRAIRQRER